MSFPTDPDPLIDPLQQDRFIPAGLHCAKCGYNLRTLPKYGVCPECGSEYDARAVELRGIFVPEMIEFPLVDAGACAISLLAAIATILSSIHPYSSGGMFFGIVLAAIGVIFALQVLRKLRLLLHYCVVYRRIRADQAAGED